MVTSLSGQKIKHSKYNYDKTERNYIEYSKHMHI